VIRRSKSPQSLDIPHLFSAATAEYFQSLKTDCGLQTAKKPSIAGLCGWSDGHSPSLLYLVLKSNGSNRPYPAPKLRLKCGSNSLSFPSAGTLPSCAEKSHTGRNTGQRQGIMCLVRNYI